ncbi:hypothetical protein GRI44_02480 [Altererythrobacter confluentis]|uniref:HTH luxR-type domain-containing protein n=1 Tax=Allopontixanthobacter confluentis TaxID=1849021 RepID=A0A6L7GCD1_9SPHN|nr:LuxR C-terminal-related transcriptional regulator [Allopontixanthobacter confluentis]MXP13619.1 hypothetical protein [Allopontixanthobacter confluentis]
MIFSKVALIDQDYRRKAKISMAMEAVGVFCDPYDDLKEFTQAPPTSTCILAADDGSYSAIEIMEELARQGCANPVIAFSDKIDLNRVTETMLAGAIDFVAWPFKAIELLDRTQSRLGVLANSQKIRMRAVSAKQKLQVLSLRENEVIAGLADGFTNKHIGKIMGISHRTVEIHRANAINKLKLDHSSKAIRLKLEADLI